MRKQTQAQQADRHALYQRAVQEPERECRLLARVYEDAFSSSPTLLREDFCGTAAVSGEWVRRAKDRRAVGVDLDAGTLAWGRAHNLVDVGARVTLLQQDVRVRGGPKVDVVTAGNFSFYILHTRAELMAYLRASLTHLKKRGVLVLEMMGGSDTQTGERLEGRKLPGFRYYWEQGEYDPITGLCDFWIHFKFPDGSVLERAFHYPWRLWNIPDVREAMEEAGFDETRVYWAQSDHATGGSNGVYTRRQNALPDPAWLAYVVGVKR